MLPFLLTGYLLWTAARATLEILIPDFVKQTSEEKPVEGDELEVLFSFFFFFTFMFLAGIIVCEIKLVGGSSSSIRNIEGW